MRAGGRIPLIIGKGLTAKAREALKLGEDDIFIRPSQPEDDGSGYTLAQKMGKGPCLVGIGRGGKGLGVYGEPVLCYSWKAQGYNWTYD